MLEVIQGSFDRGELFLERFGNPTFRLEDDGELNNGIHVAAIGNPLRADAVIELLTYPLDIVSPRQDVARGLMMLTYPNGKVTRSIARARQVDMRDAFSGVDHDDIRGIVSVLRDGRVFVEADMQLISTRQQDILVDGMIADTPPGTLISEYRAAAEKIDIPPDQLAIAAVRRMIRTNRMSAWESRRATSEFMRRLQVSKSNEAPGGGTHRVITLLREVYAANNFFNMDAYLEFPDSESTIALTKELPSLIAKALQTSPEFTVEKQPTRAASHRGDVVERTRLRFYPKTNKPDYVLQPMVAWYEGDAHGERSIVMPQTPAPYENASGQLVFSSYIVGAAWLTGIAQHAPYYPKKIARLFAHERRNYNGELPRWTAGMLPLFLQSDTESLARELPSRGYFKRQFAQQGQGSYPSIFDAIEQL